MGTICILVFFLLQFCFYFIIRNSLCCLYLTISAFLSTSRDVDGLLTIDNYSVFLHAFKFILYSFTIANTEFIEF